jgi:hypothetical protein
LSSERDSDVAEAAAPEIADLRPSVLVDEDVRRSQWTTPRM